jgi:hypothetical protein
VGGGSRKKKGGSTVKIALGVAIPLVVSGVAALVGFLLKRAKKRKEATMAAAATGGQGAYNQEKQQGVPSSGVTGTPAPPTELSQSAMYTGHEMPKQQGSTVEMPAAVSSGYKNGVQGRQAPMQGGYGQQQQAQWPQAPQAAHTAQGQQQWVQGQPTYDQSAQSPPAQQYPQGQWVFVPHAQPTQGTPHYVTPVEAPVQPASPPELPGRLG